MKRFLMSMVAAGLLAFAGHGAPASAGTIDFLGSTVSDHASTKAFDAGQNGSNDVFMNHSFHDFASSLHDVMNFELNHVSQLAIDLTTFGHVLDMTVSIFNSNNLGGPALWTTSFAHGLMGDFSNLTTVLVGSNWASDLTLIVTGDFCSCSGYKIALSDPTKTPIPPALLMFLTSLGGLGAVAWRRKKALTAA